jgi:small nuclear ribonucleoprotein B and B'
MLGLINWRLKVTITDGRALTGQMLAFDRHMNLVLADCEEFRKVRPKKKAGEEQAPEQEIKRTLGLVILRGEAVVSISVEGPPPIVDEDKKNQVSQENYSFHIQLFISRPKSSPWVPVVVYLQVEVWE